MAACFAFRINALHCPTRQILQVSPLWDDALFPFRPQDRNEKEKLREFCGESLVVSSKKIQFLVVGLPTCQILRFATGDRADFLPTNAAALYNLFPFAHNAPADSK